MVPVLVLLFVALWFILRGDLFDVLPCVILFLWFSVLLALWLPRLGKRELILVLFVRLFDLWLFGLVGFHFLLVSGKSCGLWLWHSLDFSLTLLFVIVALPEFSRPFFKNNSIATSPLIFMEIKITNISSFAKGPLPHKWDITLKHKWSMNCNET